jgi:glutathione peroxidase
MKYALAALGLALTAPAMAEVDTMSPNDFESIDGKPMNITELGAKAVLVVNTASKCGYTPQYEGLEALYEAKKDEGLVIVGVPSNDFGGQEPGTEKEVKSFCELNYGVTFPLTRKYHVVGADHHPFWDAAVAHLGKSCRTEVEFPQGSGVC